jgi:acylphosphatase
MVTKVKIIISGHVQGVMFRYYTKKTAISLGLKGYAKNLIDGNVKVIAEGDEEAIKKLIEFCKKGPEGADVSNIDVEYQEFKNEFDDFYIY